MFAYVGGEGLERYETFIDARDISGEEEEMPVEGTELTPDQQERARQLLTERGAQKLAEMETQLSFEAEILTPVKSASPFVYEEDYKLGDRVPVYNEKWGVTMDTRITEFKEIHEPSGFVLEATFGPAQPTLLKKIQEKFSELENIEKQEASQYSHPDTHPADIIEENSLRRFVTDDQISSWNNKMDSALTTLNLTLTNGASGGTRVPRVKKVGRIVQLIGNVSGVSVGTNFATLPSGYQPSEIQVLRDGVCREKCGAVTQYGRQPAAPVSRKRNDPARPVEYPFHRIKE